MLTGSFSAKEQGTEVGFRGRWILVRCNPMLLNVFCAQGVVQIEYGFFVGKLKKLETLRVDDNHLTSLPTSIGG